MSELSRDQKNASIKGFRFFKGMNGNGPLIELAVLREYAISYKPKNVVWVYYKGNDLHSDLLIEKSVPLLMRYLQQEFTQSLIYQQKEIDSRLGRYIARAHAETDVVIEQLRGRGISASKCLT